MYEIEIENSEILRSPLSAWLTWDPNNNVSPIN